MFFCYSFIKLLLGSDLALTTLTFEELRALESVPAYAHTRRNFCKTYLIKVRKKHSIYSKKVV